MAHDLAFDHINHQFTDIGGMVRDSLDVFPDEREADGAGDRDGIFDHERDQLPKQLDVVSY